MPTPNERKGLWFLALVAISGTGVRVWRSHAPEPPPTETRAMERQIGRVDSARTEHKAKRAARDSARKTSKAPKAGSRAPKVESGPVDLNNATVEAIEALPGIGPALAARIVAHRDSAGAFAGLAALCEVRGVGRAMAERLRPLVTFSGVPSPVSDVCGEASRKPRKTRADSSREPS
jgi:competence ComEA-like helix-hairpin-helix protein